jgi:hypothetical protein
MWHILLNVFYIFVMCVSQWLIKGKNLCTKCQHNFLRTQSLLLLKCLTIFKKRLISLHLTFAKICKLHGYEKYKLNDNIINVLANIDETQFILLRLPHGNSPIGIFLKHWLKYKSLYTHTHTIGNICPNIIVMLTLHNLIQTPLSEELHICIDPHWYYFVFVIHT